MERKIKLGLIFFFVLLAAGLIFFVIIQPGMQEKEIKRLLNEANHCASDSDCTILDTNFGCPFGCYNLGNKNADVTRINSLWEEYQESRRKSGSFCIYGCIEPPEQQEIKCINNKCVDTRLNQPSVPFFPVQNEPAKSQMQALLSDKELVLNNGCLRAGGFLLVWPYGFSLSTDNDEVLQVVNSAGQTVTRVGDTIKVGGGADETPDGRIARGYSTQLPGERCPGPYWIVGEVIANGTK